MITIKKLATTINYPFDELVNLIENSTTSIPLLMVGIKRHLIAPKVTITGSKIYVQERRIKAVYYPNRDGDTVVEYYYDIHWFVLVLWIVSIVPLLVGIVWVPILLFSSISAVQLRINSVNKHANNALMALNPIEHKTSKTRAKVETKIESAQTFSATPPPIKKSVSKPEYFIVVDDEQMGPFDLEKLKLLIEFKNIDGSTLIWKEGMEDWEELSNNHELSNLLIHNK
jgi:hypothetical protein